MENTVDKVIITVVGKDTVGIIAKVCTYLSEIHINVLDISQTIVSGFFNMMMIVDMSQSSRSFGDCPEGSGCGRGADRCVHQMSEGRDF